MGNKKESVVLLDDDTEDDNDWDVEDDEAVGTSVDMSPPQRPTIAKQRDWRDLERFKAERELRKLMDADNWLDDL